MRRTSRLLAALTLLCASSALAETPSQLTKDSKSDEILDALYQRGLDLKTFTAKAALRTVNNVTGDQSTRSGVIWYQSQPDGDARLHIIFSKRDEDGKILSDPSVKVEYLLDKGWLTDRDYRRQTETRRQVRKPGDKINLLKLGEGPFPLPIGQDKQTVHEEFDVTQPKVEGPDLPHVRLTPKSKTRLARSFSQIDVWVDPKTNMPVKIDTTDPSGNETRGTDLTDVQINTGVTDVDFQMDKVDPNVWTLRDESFGE
jgi:outer membrane lipoprotein-sorting protein